MKTQVLHVHPVNDQEMNTIKAFCPALNIKFEVSKGDPYDPEFVHKRKR
jgi:hypothetical protein